MSQNEDSLRPAQRRMIRETVTQFLDENGSWRCSLLMPCDCSRVSPSKESSSRVR